jgi:hypothetical protein
MSVLIFNQWDAGATQKTAVLCVLIAVGTLGLTGLLRYLGNRRNLGV